MSELTERITDVLREVIRTELGLRSGEYFPSAVFDKAAAAVAEALQPDLIGLDGELEKRRSKHAIEMDADDFDCGAERAYRETQQMLRQIIARWSAAEDKP